MILNGELGGLGGVNVDREITGKMGGLGLLFSQMIYINKQKITKDKIEITT